MSNHAGCQWPLRHSSLELLSSFVLGKFVIPTAHAMDDFPVSLRSKRPPSAPEFRPQIGDSSRVRAKPPRHAGSGKNNGAKRPAAKPLRQRVERAEAEVTRLTREIEKLDAALADGELYAREPAKAAAIAKARSEHASALAKAEEDWLAAGAALEAAAN